MEILPETQKLTEFLTGIGMTIHSDTSTYRHLKIIKNKTNMLKYNTVLLYMSHLLSSVYHLSIYHLSIYPSIYLFIISIVYLSSIFVYIYWSISIISLSSYLSVDLAS